MFLQCRITKIRCNISSLFILVRSCLRVRSCFIKASVSLKISSYLSSKNSVCVHTLNEHYPQCVSVWMSTIGFVSVCMCTTLIYACKSVLCMCMSTILMCVHMHEHYPQRMCLCMSTIPNVCVCLYVCMSTIFNVCACGLVLPLMCVHLY